MRHVPLLFGTGILMLAAGGLTFATLPWDGPATRDGQSVLLVKQPEADAERRLRLRLRRAP